MLADSVPLVPEHGQTFQQNALMKARAAARAAQLPVIADDSGIEAAALNGAPGVRSARYAGERATDEQNLQKLIAQVPAGSGLRYVCALAYVDPLAGVQRIFQAYCTGHMAQRPAGEKGFGYDPVFVPHDAPAGLTMAELSDEQKDQLSHRGLAVRAFRDWLTRAG
jgi:XTP/dITP diphosphohydrolase